MSDNIVQSLAALRLNQAVEYRILEEICEWERLEYGEGKHRIPDALQQCVEKNREGFLLILRDSKLIAYADVWELNSDFYSKLKIGEELEESLSHHHIIAPKDEKSGKWYIGSIITAPDFRREHPSAAALAFVAICNALPRFFACQKKYPATVLGVGSSAFGQRLLSRWEFESIQRSERAIDLRPRFEKGLASTHSAECFRIGRKRPTLP